MRRLRTTKILGLAALIVAIGGTMPATAGYVSAVNFTGGVISLTGAEVSAGFSFTTNQSVTIDALADFSPLGTGTNVRLYDGSGAILATTTVLSTDASDGTFRFHSITPVTLASSTTYYIAADVVIDQLGEYSVTGLTTNPGITFGAGVEAFGLGVNPTTDLQHGDFNPGYFGPSFEIQSSVVPEPSSFSLLGVGTIALLRYGWPRRKCLSV